MVERAGLRRARVRFEVQGAAGNDGGVVTAPNWRPFFGPVRARLRPLRGGETVLAGRLQSLEYFELTVLGSEAVRSLTEDHRVVDLAAPTLPLAIKNIQNPDERGREYVLLLERGKANG